MTEAIGIYWGIPEPDHSWRIVTDKSSLAEAEEYGDFLTHRNGHYDVWSRWQQLNPAALAKFGIPQAVVYHEYEDFPRGRIVYQIKRRQFIVYADRRLQRPEVISDIVHCFGLAERNYIVQSDAHYRS